MYRANEHDGLESTLWIVGREIRCDDAAHAVAYYNDIFRNSEDVEEGTGIRGDRRDAIPAAGIGRGTGAVRICRQAYVAEGGEMGDKRSVEGR